MEIEQVTSITDEVCEAFRRLMPQLTPTHLTPTKDELITIVKSEASILLIARYPNKNSHIVGAGCLVIYRVLTGMKGIIEDVVVDESARENGIGESIVRRLLDIAREKGVNGVTLTSNSKRISANRLYQRIGFAKRETNSYIYKF